MKNFTKIDLIIIVNFIVLIALLYYVFKWYNLIAAKYDRLLALLIPISFIAFCVSLNSPTNSDIKAIVAEEISQQQFNNYNVKPNEIKIIIFSKKVGLLQDLQFVCKFKKDSISQKYQLQGKPAIFVNGLNSNIKWQINNFTSNQSNDSIYKIQLDVHYEAKVAFLVTFLDFVAVKKERNIDKF